MPKFQIVIREIARYTVAVEAENEVEANAAALDEFIQAESVEPYFDSVDDREIVATVQVDDQGLPA